MQLNPSEISELIKERIKHFDVSIEAQEKEETRLQSRLQPRTIDDFQG